MNRATATWKGMHIGLAGHHVRMAKRHEKLAGNFDRLADCMSKADMNDDDGDHESVCRDIAAEHRAASEEHVSQGEFHTALAKASDIDEDISDMERNQPYTRTRKAVGMSRDDELIPDNVVGVIPDAVAPNIRAIPRYGQPDMSKVDETLPAHLQNLVKVESEDQD